MRRMYSQNKIKSLGLEAINAQYNADGELEHNDPEVFNEDVEFKGKIIDKNGNEVLAGGGTQKYKHQIVVGTADAHPDNSVCGVIEYVDNSNANITALTDIPLTVNLSGTINTLTKMGSNNLYYHFTLYGPRTASAVKGVEYTEYSSATGAAAFNTELTYSLDYMKIVSQIVEAL